jgi:hypothetical protein
MRKPLMKKSLILLLLNIAITSYTHPMNTPDDLHNQEFTAPSKQELMQELGELENFEEVTGCISKIAEKRLLGVQAIETRWNLAMFDYIASFRGSWQASASQKDMQGITALIKLTNSLRPRFFQAVLKNYPLALQELRNNNTI